MKRQISATVTFLTISILVLSFFGLSYGQIMLDPSSKIESSLLEEITAKGETGTTTVGIWLRQEYDPNDELLMYDEAKSDNEREASISRAQSLINETEQPFVDWITGQGYPVVYRCRYAPLVFVEMTSKGVYDAAARIDVDYIYISRTYEKEMDHAEKSVRADVAWARGLNGSSLNPTRVAIIETGEIDFGNPYLNHVIDKPVCNPGVGEDDHLTSVAGVIAAATDGSVGNHGRYRGVAYGIKGIINANPSSDDDYDVIKASEWARDQGGRLFNCSFGEDTDLKIVALDRYYDYIIRNFYISVFKSAGNKGTGTGNVTSPGLAYNVITVGSFSPDETNKWNDDGISTFSSYRPSDGNPVGQDRQKPEIVACGEDNTATHKMHRLYTSAPWVREGIGGTSFAAPAVAGAAYLLVERDLGLLVDVPALKAILLASACHNIEGDKRLSNKDGAGALVICEAEEVVSNNQYHKENLIDLDFQPDGYWSYNINLEKQKTARVALSWFSNPSRQKIVGISTALTATRLTDNTNPFGADDSKIGWILIPDTNDIYGYRVTDNSAGWVEIEGGDLTTEANVGDTYALVQDDLDANLDLKVWDNTLNDYAWDGPNSTGNNYEIARFMPANTGQYEIRVFNTTWNGTLEPAGIAWAQEPCCSPDWGDAPDDMLACPTRPQRGDFPTLQSSNGANVREYEVEWLSAHSTTAPGATWELDANVDPYANEKDQDKKSNIIPAACSPNHDIDDGVMPDPVYIAGTRGRVSFWVNTATPNVDRYSDLDPEEHIHVFGWFDWEHDDTTWEDNVMVYWDGGPSDTGEMLVGDCIEGCDVWDTDENQKKVTAEFDVPDFESSGPFWIRFRIDYGELLDSWRDTATYGEIEDHISYQFTPLSIPYLYGDIRTDSIRTIFSNTGNLGNAAATVYGGNGGYNMNYFDDCDDTMNIAGADDQAAVYLYDASPFVAYVNNEGDTILNYSMYSSAWYSENCFNSTTAPMVDSVSDPNYQKGTTGVFYSHDTSLAMECEYYAPTDPEFSDFIVAVQKIYGTGTGAGPYPTFVGDFVDFNIPSDSGAENGSSYSEYDKMIYQYGAEYGEDSISTNDCVFADQRYGGYAYYGGYRLPYDGSEDSFPEPRAMWTQLTAEWVEPKNGFVPKQMYPKIASQTGYSAWYTEYIDPDSDFVDLHAVAVFGEFDLGGTSNDTLVFCKIYMSEYDGDIMGLEETRYLAGVWIEDHEIFEYPASSCDCVPGEANNDDTHNIFDITYIISYLYRSGPSPTPYELCSGDANCDCTTNIFDITYLISYLYLSGPPPCTCEEWLDSCGSPLRK